MQVAEEKTDAAWKKKNTQKRRDGTKKCRTLVTKGRIILLDENGTHPGPRAKNESP